MKIDANKWFWQTKSSYLLNDLRKLNVLFRKNVTYDNTKTHKKAAFYPLFRRPQAVLWLTRKIIKKCKRQKIKRQIHSIPLLWVTSFWQSLYVHIFSSQRKEKEKKNITKTEMKLYGMKVKTYQIRTRNSFPSTTIKTSSCYPAMIPKTENNIISKEKIIFLTKTLYYKCNCWFSLIGNCWLIFITTFEWRLP